MLTRYILCFKLVILTPEQPRLSTKKNFCALAHRNLRQARLEKKLFFRHLLVDYPYLNISQLWNPTKMKQTTQFGVI